MWSTVASGCAHATASMALYVAGPKPVAAVGRYPLVIAIFSRSWNARRGPSDGTSANIIKAYEQATILAHRARAATRIATRSRSSQPVATPVVTATTSRTRPSGQPCRSSDGARLATGFGFAMVG
jgi:hypothetical protein